MLQSLHIENVAVIEKTDIQFKEGFTILTGETGAGKSIIIDSIELVLGERASKDMIRNGAQKAYVSALFSVDSKKVTDVLNGYGIQIEDDNTILIEREFSMDGRNICRINGRQVALSVIKSIGMELINIHGQHSNQALLNPDTHITYLDSYTKNDDLLIRYKDIYENLKRIKHEIAELSKNERDKETRLDFLKYQINEIESADLKQGEEEELSEKRMILTNSVKLFEASDNAYNALYKNESNASDLINEAISNLNSASRYSTKLSDISSRLTDLSYNLNDCIEEIRSFKDDIDFEAGSLSSVEERLDIIYRLKKKYGNSIQEILSYLENVKDELNKIEFSEEHKQKLEAVEKSETENLKKAAEALTASRIKSAEMLNIKVVDELKFLDMEKVKFKVSIENSEEFLPNGKDIIEFFISTNAGEALKPLAKIASGGELSRIMLSIKNVMSNEDDINTLIFDEVDSGVSGKSAQKIGIKLKQISKGKQVICITHLAQIACLADNHYLIKKGEANGRTFTSVTELDYEGRKHELARIIGGIEITDITLKNADELLKASKALL